MFDDLIDVKKGLQDKYEENQNILALLDERARMSKVNQLDYQVSSIFGMFMIPYIILLLAYIVMIATNRIDLIVNFISIPNCVLGMNATSLGIGVTVNMLTNKKYKIKERFKKFSNAKTESEKIEEQLSYELKLKKLQNRNLVLEKALKELENADLKIIDLSKYKNISTSSLPKELENVLNNKYNLTLTLEKKYNELDLLTIQKYLTNELCKFRIKGQDTLEALCQGTFIGMIPFMYLVLPIIPISMLEIAIPQFSIFGILGTLGISELSTITYNLSKNKTQKKFFNKLNESLEEKKLPTKVENVQEEINKIDSLIKRKISDICKIELQIEECNRSLDTLGSKEKIEKIEEFYKTISSKTEKQESFIKDEPTKYAKQYAGMYTEEEIKEKFNTLNEKSLQEEPQKIKTLKR